MKLSIKTLDDIRDSRVRLEITIEPGELDTQVSYDLEQEAEIQRLKDELARYRMAHVCTDSCTKNAHVAFTGKEMVATLEATLAESREWVTEMTRQLQESRELVEFKNRVIDGLADERNRLAEEWKKANQLRTAAETLLAQETAHVNRLSLRESELEAELADSQKRAKRAQDAINGRDLAIGELHTVRAQARSLKDRLEARDQLLQETTLKIQDMEHRLEKKLATLQDATHRLGEIEKIVNHAKVDDAIDRSVTKVSDVLAEAVKGVRETLSSSPAADTSQA